MSPIKVYENGMAYILNFSTDYQFVKLFKSAYIMMVI